MFKKTLICLCVSLLMLNGCGPSKKAGKTIKGISGMYYVVNVEKKWPADNKWDDVGKDWEKLLLFISERKNSIEFRFIVDEDNKNTHRVFEMPKNEQNSYIYRNIESLNWEEKKFVTIELEIHKKRITTTFNINMGDDDLIKRIEFIKQKE